MNVLRRPEVEEKRFKWDAGNVSFSQTPSFPKTEPFIAGPLPLEWINQAASLPGKAIHVGLALWFLSGVCKSRSISLGAKQLERMGVARNAKYQALGRLQEARLISVAQQPGKLPMVTLLDAPKPHVTNGSGELC